MELTVNGEQGEEAKFAVDVTPERGSTIILGEGLNAKLISETADFKKIGEFPFKTKVTFVFHVRPWSFTIQQQNGISFSTSSEAQGLRNTATLTPDVASLYLNFSTNQA